MKPNKVIMKESKDGNTQKLKNRIKKLENENRRLKSELISYEQAFKNTTKFLKDHTSKFSIEDLIDSAKRNKTLKETEDDIEVKEVCPKCLSEIDKVELPFGTMISCKKLCGYRKVSMKNEEK